MFYLERLCLILAIVAGAVVSSLPTFSLLEERIVGGADTTIQEFPYQISLEFEGRHNCGGSVISATHILTAAHCVEGREPHQFSVRAGSTIRQSGGQFRKVVEIIEHPNWNTFTVDYDVAILVLDQPLIFGENVQTIRLHRLGDDIEPGTRAVVAGWGILHTNGNQPKILQKVDLYKVSDEQCKIVHGQARITSRMTCYAHHDNGKGTCQSDSGGPLIVDGVQVGIVSWGPVECGAANLPEMYAKISQKEIHEFIAPYL